MVDRFEMSIKEQLGDHRYVDAVELLCADQRAYLAAAGCNDPFAATILKYVHEQVQEMLLTATLDPDVIRVVRCRDCIKRHTASCPAMIHRIPKDDSYCSEGRRAGEVSEQ